jgi:hypothetical protein
MGGEVLQTSLEKNAIYRQTQITLYVQSQRRIEMDEVHTCTFSIQYVQT